MESNVLFAEGRFNFTFFFACPEPLFLNIISNGFEFSMIFRLEYFKTKAGWILNFEVILISKKYACKSRNQDG